MSVRMEQLGPNWTDFNEILCMSIFKKICRENSSSIYIGQKAGPIHHGQHTFLIISSSILLVMKNVLDKRCTENQNRIQVG
jgi:hypothetical protein